MASNKNLQEENPELELALQIEDLTQQVADFIENEERLESNAAHA
jgi:hypothetical protein